LALDQIFCLLKSNGSFIGVMPDLEYEISAYLNNKNKQERSYKFLESTMLGISSRERGLLSLLRKIFGNSSHLWLYDFSGFESNLRDAGFTNITRVGIEDLDSEMFADLANSDRWKNCLGFSCVKP